LEWEASFLYARYICKLMFVTVKLVYRDTRLIGREQCEEAEVDHASSVGGCHIWLLYSSATVNGRPLLAEPKLNDIYCRYNQIGNKRPL
jgi:hypothetical protein